VDFPENKIKTYLPLSCNNLPV